MKTSADKIRVIVNWLNYQNETFNDKLRTISDIEKVYDYCQENDTEFLDDLSYLDKDDYIKISNELFSILGYSII